MLRTREQLARDLEEAKRDLAEAETIQDRIDAREDIHAIQQEQFRRGFTGEAA